MMDTPIPDGSISVRESADAPLIWFFLFGSWKVEASSLSQRLPFFLLGAHNLGPQGAHPQPPPSGRGPGAVAGHFWNPVKHFRDKIEWQKTCCDLTSRPLNLRAP